jgi:ubiquinone/menaquinone biosynthesis C-methylase UbiE
MPKDRGIEHVQRYFGDFLELVEKKIHKKGKVKILDAGCGFGVAMIGLVKKFGNKIEIIGFNYDRRDGNLKKMEEQSIEKNILTKEELKKIKNLPKILYVDANKKLPFKNNDFDFIYGMASVYLYDEKIKFLEECNRILKKEGLARISVAFYDHKKMYSQKQGSKIKKWFEIPDQYSNFWEVWDKGKEIKIWDYCKKIKGLKVVGKDKESKQYLEIRKQPKIDFKLKLIGTIDLNFIWKKWGGVKSIYSTQINFKPKWKKH